MLLLRLIPTNTLLGYLQLWSLAGRDVHAQRFPECSAALREAQILQIQWAAMVFLVRMCTRPADRPSMGDIMKLLGRD